MTDFIEVNCENKGLFKVNPPSPSRDDFIVTNRPTIDNLNAAKKGLKIILMFLQLPSHIKREREASVSVKAYLDNLGLDLSDNIMVIFVPEGRTESDVCEEFMTSWEAAKTPGNFKSLIPFGCGNLLASDVIGKTCGP